MLRHSMAHSSLVDEEEEWRKMQGGSLEEGDVDPTSLTSALRASDAQSSGFVLII